MSTGAQPLELMELPLHGSRLIEASAGTGKTYTIAALYLRLVLGHGELPEGTGELTPPQILVMTFTEAATRELRERIRAVLARGARILRGEPAPAHEALWPALLDAYPEPAARAGAARRLELAAEWMDEAAVSTIHSWCYRMLREHAFDSGSLFNQRLEADQSELQAEAARDYWRRFVYPQPADHLKLLRQAFGEGPDELQARVRPLLGHLTDTAGLEPYRTPDGLYAELATRLARLAELKAVWREDAAEVERQFRELLANVLLGTKYQKPDELIEVMRAWAEDPAALLPDKVGTTPVLERMCAAGMAERLKKGKSLPDDLHPAFTALNAAAEVCADDSERLLQAAAVEIDLQFRQAQRVRVQMGFNDLLLRLRDALEGPGGEALAETLRRQFPVALVDEFQDTDPVQYRILERVYRIEDNPSEQGLLLIGDPKQAIYGFRGADIHSYLKARRATAGRHYTLPRNFRSTARLVGAVNRLFAHADGWSEGAFLFGQGDDGELPFHAVDAQDRGERLEQDGAEVTALTLWCMDPGTPVGTGVYREQMATAAAEQMVRLLTGGTDGTCGFRDSDALRPVRPRDIAVLVRSKVEARIMQEALRARGVRSVYLSEGESVFVTPEAGDLLRWLRACAEPTSERLLRAALATPTLGQSLADLHRLTTDELRWEHRVEQFREYRRLWQTRGVLPMLRRLLHDFDVPRRLLASADGERALTNLLHLSELLQRAAAELDGEQALIRHLVEHREGERATAEEQVLRLESDEDLVKVVTLHKSKGLEYPLVFLPFVCAFRAVDPKKDVPRIDRPPGGRPRWIFRMDTRAQERADRERLAEDLRLLYVGMTRARHACWMGLVPIVSGRSKENELHRSAVGYLLNGPEPMPNGELEDRLQAARGDEAAIAIEPLPEITGAGVRLAQQTAAPGRARTPTRPVREPWWVASYSAIAHPDEADAPAPLVADPVAPDSALEDMLRESAVGSGAGSQAGHDPTRALPLPEVPVAGGLHDFPRGPAPGTFLHGLLEWAAEQGWSAVVADRARLDDEVQKRCEQRDWGDWTPVVQDWMRRLITAEYALASGGAFRLDGLGVYQPELEFLFETRWLQSRRLDAAVREQLLPGQPRPSAGDRLLNGMLKGFVDLVFEHEGRYYVADYKSNWLGPGPEAYVPERLRDAVLEHRYDLQLVIYTLALHRQLQARMPGYDYDRHMGGGVYLFLRGIDAPGRGVFHDCPPRALIEQLDGWFAEGPDRPQEARA
ncbi:MULTISPECIES: exodeoxyribonuclease V subunit beta [unclassified Thioalkalivibrio]|uniref:exodeoxyribonuclease V subunit beta n=1 Tax=unclassified Thioalkalivibrio TaxID=2621013 RepID=UPI00036F8ED7|nr:MULTISPECIES: exodeoxyribonuclease V subunit beta [unclassified Thioalkalivibrio]